MFIVIVNSLDIILVLLLDRMEMIYILGYIMLEKRYIVM